MSSIIIQKHSAIKGNSFGIPVISFRPQSNLPGNQPRSRRRIVRDGSVPAACSHNRSIVSEFSPIGSATSTVYDHRLVTNSLEPANVGWQNNGCKNLTSN